MRRHRTLQEGRGRCRSPARSRIGGGWRVRWTCSPRRLPGAGDNNSDRDDSDEARGGRRREGGGRNDGGGAVAALRTWDVASTGWVVAPPTGRVAQGQEKSPPEGRAGQGTEEHLDQLRMHTCSHAPARLSRRRAATPTTAAGRLDQGLVHVKGSRTGAPGTLRTTLHAMGRRRIRQARSPSPPGTAGASPAFLWVEGHHGVAGGPGSVPEAGPHEGPTQAPRRAPAEWSHWILRT